MGVFMNKETLHAEAERLGVSLEGLKWQEQQKAVLDAKKAAGEPLQYGKTVSKGGTGHAKESQVTVEQIDAADSELQKREYCNSDNEEYVDWRSEPIPQKPIVIVESTIRDENTIEAIRERVGNRTIVISPEIRPTINQVVKYDEELGFDLDIEERSLKDDFELGRSFMATSDHEKGSYVIKGKKSTKVMAQSSLPKENASIEANPLDPRVLFPIVTFNGQRGYLWTHQTLPNVKELLQDSGYYQEMKEEFLKPGVMFYLTGLCCVSIPATHNLFREIEQKEANKRRLGL